MTVIDYVTEEVERQGHNTRTLDGIERVGWMLNAWSYALAHDIGEYCDIAIALGRLVEPHKNAHGIRTCQVRVGARVCPDYVQVFHLIEGLFRRRGELTPLEFYKAFEEIHPFLDGNGRTGKILLNMLNGTLLNNPIFPPDDFWGRPIRNP